MAGAESEHIYPIVRHLDGNAIINNCSNGAILFDNQRMKEGIRRSRKKPFHSLAYSFSKCQKILIFLGLDRTANKTWAFAGNRDEIDFHYSDCTKCRFGIFIPQTHKQTVTKTNFPHLSTGPGGSKWKSHSFPSGLYGGFN